MEELTQELLRRLGLEDRKGVIVTAVEPAERRVRVRFDEREVEYARKELDQLVLAYAITVHKAQGSEFDEVLVVLPERQKLRR